MLGRSSLPLLLPPLLMPIQRLPLLLQLLLFLLLLLHRRSGPAGSEPCGWLRVAFGMRWQPTLPISLARGCGMPRRQAHGRPSCLASGCQLLHPPLSMLRLCLPLPQLLLQVHRRARRWLTLLLQLLRMAFFPISMPCWPCTRPRWRAWPIPTLAAGQAPLLGWVLVLALEV